ncbi:acyl-protein synthetase [Lacrimispora indolis]|uniref:LuxE/PaaK family acyltransferase n=1 Tax=Lacrimispora indolis TaxID=69825 RepID=UPI00041915A1|nr:acyl-protein synthetase [[Clostridium] methoxybenzovorans]
MMDYEGILNRKPFSAAKDEKKLMYGEWLTELTYYHRKHCHAYGQFLKHLMIPERGLMGEEEIPMLPVGLFKDMDLISIPGREVFKTMTSSGTKGQTVSRIYLDRDTADYQQRALANIGGDFWGEERLPFLVLDSPEVLKDRNLFSARGAGILGFSIFSSRICYGLDRDMNLDMDGIRQFLERYGGKGILIFGFTYMIWKYFYQVLAKSGQKLDLSEGILIHGGGFKKLEDQSVSSHEFKERIGEASGIKEIHNYYGMAEQTGSIYMECSQGHFHASLYSDIITRRAKDFSVCSHGEKGIIQVLSPLALSYPGHSILTEDEGIILGEDDCPCGRLGKYFKVLGRIRQAEIRGCSDTYDG